MPIVGSEGLYRCTCIESLKLQRIDFDDFDAFFLNGN